MGDQGQNVFVPIMTDKIGRNTAVGLVSAVDSCDDEAVKPGLIPEKVFSAVDLQIKGSS